MLTAVRAYRGQLEAVQTVDTAVSAREVRGSQPRLAAVRAQWAEIDRIFLCCRLIVIHALSEPTAEGSPTRRIRAMKKPAVRSRWGIVSRASRHALGWIWDCRSCAEVLELEVEFRSRNRSTCCSFSARGDRARGIDQHAARTKRAGAGRRESPSGFGPTCSMSSRGHTPAQVGASLERAQTEHGGSMRTRS